MSKKLRVDIKILRRQMRLVDKITAAFSDNDGIVPPSRKTALVWANDFEGLANFLSELNAALEECPVGIGRMVYRGKEGR